MGDGYDLRRASWVGLKYAISYVPSIQGFLAARKAALIAGGDLSFLGIGDPDLISATGEAQTAGESQSATAANDFSNLPPLPETADELKFAATALDGGGAKLLLGSNATEKRFRLEPLSRYNVIAVATHGLVQNDIANLNEMALVLTPGHSADAYDDGLLKASEIASLELRARLVVLSACNTANFDLQIFSSEIQGLTMALALSGVPTELASLWPVESAESTQLMKHFYSDLARDAGRPVSEVFAEAQREIYKDAPSRAYLHPRFWAPFVILGYGSTAVVTPVNPQPYWKTTRRTVEYTDSLSEIVAVSPLRTKNLLAVSEIGPAAGSRHPAILELRGLGGAVVWQYKTADVGAGRVATGRNAIYWATSRYYGPSRNSAELEAFDANGHRLWSRKIENHEPWETIDDLVVDETERIAVVVHGHVASPASPRAWARSTDEIRLVIFSSDGREVSNRLLGSAERLATGSILRAATITASGNTFVVGINSGRGIEPLCLPKIRFVRSDGAAHQPRARQRSDQTTR